MTLPPGILFLGRNLFIPTLSIFLIQGFVTHSTYGLGLPKWAAPFIAILAAVTFLVARTVFTGISRARAAEAMGARLVPCAKGTWPGSVDLLRKMLASYKSGYLGKYCSFTSLWALIQLFPGDGFAALTDSLGPVMNIRMLWSDKIFTVAPEHIQIILATDFKNYVKGNDPSVCFLASLSIFPRSTVSRWHGFRSRGECLI